MKLRYYAFGEGAPLIILHGLFGFSDNWQTVGKKLAARYHVHLLDLRNHGRSPHDDAFNYEVMARDVHEFIEDRHWNRVCIIGHSLGGKVAMQLAAQQPSLIEALVVVDIAPRAYPAHHGPVLEALHSVRLETHPSRQEAEERMKVHISDPGVRQFLLKNLYRDENNRLAWRMNLEAIERHIDEVGKALPAEAEYTGPTLFIAGGQSGYITGRDVEDIQRHFPLARITTIEGAGHWVHAEAPEAFLKTVFDFLPT